MTKAKYTLILLGIFNLVLFIVHLTDFSFLFLKPTGYIIPIVINMIVLAVLGFCSSLRNVWVFTGLFLSMPILLVHSFMVFMSDNSYTTIHSPHGQQSLFIEYRDFTLGETTYFYNFHETRFGFIGRYLDDQSMRIMDRNFPPGIDGKEVLGLHDAEWITDETVRLPTWEGMEEIELESSPSTPDPTPPTADEGDMETFIDAVEKEEDGETITIHGNVLETRYDENTGQSWIDVSDNEGEGAIPTQQCSRVEEDEKRGYYMLVECTHQWEYRLQSLDSEQ
ncbi:hypothetical protein HUG15_05935 [Salicibibacter cibarius]|uniref:Uncharacterized protein n=1 Tax=Salicibibacter cibarius TaxID=2743000 RepID=A0A7T6Z1D4_9BACI|nr:hypothetical protein [Salicibibacter cibarius]QQK75193.1 hypothetical protein HUG15_05935 [Salicibibacter cibarius]